MSDIPIVKKDKYMSWDTYFMSVAVLSSFRSKDLQSNGACISDKDKKIIGIGYNGLPIGLDDNKLEYWMDEDDEDIERSKHTYVVHAEKNAIYNSMNHNNLKNSTIYVTQFPCNVCTQAIIQVGIKRVVYLMKKEHSEKHLKRNSAVKKMFDDCKVTLDYFYDLDIDDNKFIEKLKTLNESFYINN